MNGPAAHGMDFAQCFEALTGYTALRWQGRLFDALANGKIPPVIDLPTGLGKTSVIPIWLIALVLSDGAAVPRRLVYIVNRRTVVDQATDVVEQMGERLRDHRGEQWKQHEATLDDLARRLRALGSGEQAEALGVSTLRGELADNEEWKTDPARPAIIVGTIDMIGSKLLLSGYGDGRYNRAQHAGLIGQDSLIVHDEAHLTPAFSRLLRAVEDEQRKELERGGEAAKIMRPIRVMELSATTRRNGDNGRAGAPAAVESFGIELADGADSVVQQRLTATKRLSLIDAAAQQKGELVTAIAEQAIQYGDKKCRVLLYIRSPETAIEVAAAIREGRRGSADDHVKVLTGTIRGYERDRLAESDLFKAFRSDPKRLPQLERTLYLVSTSAGEVGADWDSDHLVCDLNALDSMIQRFGRVNRLGGKGRLAEITVIVEKAAEGAEGKAVKKSETSSPLDAAIAKTREILNGIADDGGDVSPAALTKVFDGLPAEEKRAAFSPEPRILPATDILLDNWSLTSIDNMPGRPEVAAYLHGVTADPPETYVAWRKDVALFRNLQPSRDGLSEGAFQKVEREFGETLRDWFSACRIESRERLRDRTDRVRNTLDGLLKAHQKHKEKDRKGFDDFSVVLLDERGRAEWSTLSAIVRKPERNAPDVLQYRTVVLPTEAGGLGEHGMLDATATESVEHIDVADAATGIGRRERWLNSRSADGERFERVITGETAESLPAGLREKARVILKERPEGAEEEGQTLELILLTEPAEAAVENPETAKFRQTLDDHTQQIVAHAERIGNALNLPEDVRDAVMCAARWHDRGKDRPVWQRFARNDNGAAPLAKSTRYLHGRALGGYRHEFGSLLEAMADERLHNHAERDLLLHLIASHHGWARPHFEPRAFDHEGPLDPTTGQRRPPTTAQNEQAGVETLQRFGRLQQRFGRWGLAWLESLLRCADIQASQHPIAGTPTSRVPRKPDREEVGA